MPQRCNCSFAGYVGDKAQQAKDAVVGESKKATGNQNAGDKAKDAAGSAGDAAKDAGAHTVYIFRYNTRLHWAGQLPCAHDDVASAV